MPTSKDEPKPRKVIDVTEPGKSEPSASGRPIIVTNRPILQQDPMVVSSDGEADVENVPSGNAPKTDTGSTSYREGHVIMPPSAPQVPAGSEKIDKAPTAVDDKVLVKVTTTHASVDEPEEKAKAQVSETSSPEMHGAKDVGEVGSIDTKKETPKTSAPEPETKGATEPPESDEEKPASNAGDDQLAPNKTVDEAAKKAQEEKAAKEAEEEKIIESKKYFLPINAVQHRRNKVRVSLLFLVFVLLVVALLDISLDAGLLKINGIQPLTHFFSTPS